jgi:hypothetical protein
VCDCRTWDEHGVDPQDTAEVQGLLVLRLQDQRAVQLNPGHRFPGPGPVSTVRGQTVPGQVGEVVPPWESQPEDHEQPKVGLLGTADSGLAEGCR